MFRYARPESTRFLENAKKIHALLTRFSRLYIGTNSGNFQLISIPVGPSRLD